jgi:hypothetical protein
MLLTALLVLTAAPPAPLAPADVVTRVGAELDCKPSSKDPLRSWCVATLTTGAGFTPPKDGTVLLGLSAPLPASKGVSDALLGGTRVSALAFKGGKVKLTDVTPDSDDEKRQLLDVAMQVAQQLKGSGKPLEVPAGLAAFLPTLAAQAAQAGVSVKESAKGPAQFKLRNPTRAWTVKFGALTVYVVAEDTTDGAWLSVYPQP